MTKSIRFVSLFVFSLTPFIVTAQTPPLRGDMDLSGSLELTDPVRILGFLFRGGDGAPCESIADADANDSISLTDAVFLLTHLFRGGATPLL